MAQALPLAKLTSLFIKTLSKPLAKQVKHQLSHYPIGQTILKTVGQGTHQVTSRMTIWSSGYRVRSISPLEDKEAMKIGADFIGETVVIGVSAGIVIWEYNRSAKSNQKKADKKRAMAKAERDALQAKLVTLDVRLKALEEVVKSNSQTILGLGIGGKTYHEPTNTVPIQEEGDTISVANGVATESSEQLSKAPKKSKSWWNIFGL